MKEEKVTGYTRHGQCSSTSHRLVGWGWEWGSGGRQIIVMSLNNWPLFSCLGFPAPEPNLAGHLEQTCEKLTCGR